MKLMVDIRGDISVLNALNMVYSVIEAGKISETKGVPQFCHATTFPSGCVVYVRPKKSEESADSFVVYRDPKPLPKSTDQSSEHRS